MELASLKAEIRETHGNGPGRVLRGQGRVPAVIYGPNREPKSLSVDKKELEIILKIVSRHQSPVDIVIGGDQPETKRVLVREVQINPVSKKLIHVDFHEYDQNRKIRVMVPVVIKGRANGVEMGGMLQVVRRELEVLCLPMEIPESIELDVSHLEIGDSIHVKEIGAMDNIDITTDVNFTVVTVLGANKGKEDEEGAQETEAAAEETSE